MNASRFLFDPVYEEIVTNFSDLSGYFLRHILIEVILPLSIFISVMLTFLIDWSCIPISSIDRNNKNNIEDLKKRLLE